MTSRRAERCLALTILTSALLAFMLGGFAGCGGGDDSSPGTDGGPSDATTDATTDACSAGNLQTDPENCGACGMVCGSGDDCVSGECVAPCSLGQSRCSGRCVAFETDNVNCGACGVVCATGLVCSNGTCAVTCALPLTTCVTGETGDGDGGLADAAVDAGADAAVDAGDASAADASALDAASPEPARYCASTASDQDNCGACGVTCAQGKQCSQGACSDTCSIGETLCGSGASSACRDLATDLANCGACGTTCAAGRVCSGGVCQADCGLPYTRCGNVCSNVGSDPANCGGCGTVCTPANVKAPACASGACTFIGCQKGFSDCDGNAANGCELPTGTDPQNCGGCALQCNGVHVTATACSGGSCGYSACQPGWGDCDGIVANGCEADLTTAATCGSCTQVCNSGASPTCSTASGVPTCMTGTTSYISPDFGATVTLPTTISWTLGTAGPSAIFYTLDGTNPTTASAHGESPLVLSNVATADGSTTVLKWITYDGNGTSAVQTRTIARSSAVTSKQSWVIPTNVSFDQGVSTGSPFFASATAGDEVSFTATLQVSSNCGTAGAPACTGFGQIVFGIAANGCDPLTVGAWPGQTGPVDLTFQAPETPGTYPVQISSSVSPNSDCGIGNFAANVVTLGWLTVTQQPAIAR